ncbi:hypothetical protein T09_11010 [Trichinella sp. T9]|nr:hypothetical protein T09_11010 [Trichinella sp. T9]
MKSVLASSRRKSCSHLKNVLRTTENRLQQLFSAMNSENVLQMLPLAT